MMGRWWRRLAWTALIAIGASTIAAGSAHAGTYTVWSCRDADGAPIATTGWAQRMVDASPGDVEFSDTCAEGGALDVQLATGRTFPASARGYLAFEAPRGMTIAGYRMRRAVRAAASAPGYPHNFVAAVRERVGVTFSDWGCASVLVPPNFNCSVMGDFADPDDPFNDVDRTGLALDALEVWAGCWGNGCVEPFAPPPAWARLYGAAIDLDDPTPPTAPQLSGTLVDGAPLTGRAALVVESADEGGGIAAMTLAVDGGAPQTLAPAGPRGACREPYGEPQPCPAAAARVFTVDTSELADGAHTAAGTVVDAGGNATPFGPIAFTVAHPVRDGGDPPGGGPPVMPMPTPTPVPVPPVVPAPPVAPTPPAGNGMPAVRRPRLTLERPPTARGDRPVRITGTLRTGGGAPIAGARLTVATRELGITDDELRTLAPITTTARGTFSLRLRADGAQRVVVAFAPTADAADTATARATVRTVTTLGIARSRARLRRGEAVTLSGRLTGAGAAAHGAVVELQAIVGGSWRTVGTVQADARGRYQWRYRFVRVTRDTIFSFRAVVQRSPGWPWPTRHSARVEVRVDAKAPRPSAVAQARTVAAASPGA